MKIEQKPDNHAHSVCIKATRKMDSLSRSGNYSQVASIPLMKGDLVVAISMNGEGDQAFICQDGKKSKQISFTELLDNLPNIVDSISTNNSGNITSNL